MYQICFILEWQSTCFGRSFCPSSGVKDCTYSNRHLSNRYCRLKALWLFAPAGCVNGFYNQNFAYIFCLLATCYLFLRVWTHAHRHTSCCDITRVTVRVNVLWRQSCTHQFILPHTQVNLLTVPFLSCSSDISDLFHNRAWRVLWFHLSFRSNILIFYTLRSIPSSVLSNYIFSKFYSVFKLVTLLLWKKLLPSRAPAHTHTYTHTHTHTRVRYALFCDITQYIVAILYRITYLLTYLLQGAVSLRS